MDNNMNEKQKIKASKFLSFVLRHNPGSVGLTLDANGWVPVADLLEGCKRNGTPLTLDQLKDVVATNEKKRFAFSDDGTKIRASQGHSIEVDLDYKPAEPPDFLFHGTATRFLDAIHSEGLTKQGRHHVHLSADMKTATAVGQRHGKPVVLTVDAKKMHEAGHKFFLSANGVWLTDAVTPEFLTFPY